MNILSRLRGRKFSFRVVYQYAMNWISGRVVNLVADLGLYKNWKYKDKFCSKPFDWFEVKSDGSVYLCCSGYLTKPIGNLHNQSPDEIWNSKTAKRIRRSIHNGSFAYCSKSKCPQLVQNSLPTKEYLQDSKWHKVIEKKLAQLKFKPATINAGWDRSCNLSCPSCRTDLINLNEQERKKAEAIQDKILEWDLREVETIYITGSGDAFASLVYREFMKKFDSKKYPNTKIKLHSNGLLFTPAIWNILKGIQSCVEEVEISIDAASDKTYAYLRRGGKFQTLLKRLEFIKELKENGKFPKLQFSFVVQKKNYREMPQFVELAKEYRADTVLFNKISDWGTMTTQELKESSVHEKEHPLYDHFQGILANPILNDPIVDLGNLPVQ